MPQGPSLIFDKSSLESLNIDEAVLLDNFYLSNITPLFFVECLADLEKTIRSNSTPEQLVGSLADRTPEAQSCPNVHHLSILDFELQGKFDMKKVYFRPIVAGGRPTKLGGEKGVVFQQSPEAEALQRWTKREFLDLERQIAKQWRQTLASINFNDMIKLLRSGIGPWRKPKSLEDAKYLADAIIDHLDQEWILRFGLALLGIPQATETVIGLWRDQRRPPLREHLPYFIFLLTINIFFCLVLPTELLRNVKPSHQVDLAYLYYLPFCTVFTSKDRFHTQVVPLFLDPFQTFVHADNLKNDLARLDKLYSALSEEEQKAGLITFASTPPDDNTFLVTQLWDKYLPGWRAIKARSKPQRDPEADKKLFEELKQRADAPTTHEEHEIDTLDYLTIHRNVKLRKGKYQRFSQAQEQRMRENDLIRKSEAGEHTNIDEHWSQTESQRK
jgi:hypothetical protein